MSQHVTRFQVPAFNQSAARIAGLLHLLVFATTITPSNGTWWNGGKKKKLNKLIKNTTAPLFFLPFPYLIVLLHLTASSDGGVDSKHHRSITRRSVDHLLLPKTTPEKNSTQHSYPTLPSATHPQNKFRPPKKSPKKPSSVTGHASRRNRSRVSDRRNSGVDQ